MIKKYRFLIKNFTLELLVVIIGAVLFYLLRDFLPHIQNIEFNRAAFNESISSLNIGLIFAVFLAIFTSDSSDSIKDARKHWAFNQPLFVILLNSVILCAISAFSTSDEWLTWTLTLCDITMITPNIKMMWDLVRISRRG